MKKLDSQEEQKGKKNSSRKKAQKPREGNREVMGIKIREDTGDKLLIL